ncbi:L-rhamnose mutarotase [Wenyingzhuangia heitensis]|uniref:L-rhamnose mutarotase n=1 Tax=Wenyingzhuangia heitensis TaxID=1487859 RepID=A0ABX0U7M6_9FLAO|nr:L-rhamnose mutarotase [Wenyingzhuangia heitensis]NIJ43750.1 L-rhamnose mutarotase [Wenyingzhuangia heitensis]
MKPSLFRRFTYLVSDAIFSINFLEKINAKETKQKLHKAGIITLEVYQKEAVYFLLIDTISSFNSLTLQGVLSNLGITIINFSFEKTPLERIYELDQKEIYKPKTGQLKTTTTPYKRFVWTLLLQKDSELIAEYKKVHSIGQAWPEITTNMKSVGVKDMEIYLAGTQAILIMDTIPDFNLEVVGPKWQQMPRETEWQTYVSKFQRTNPESSIQEKWQDLNLIASILK